ncbi:hypothetical protein [Ascidiimonas aurantiaca]|uniref:hypothetical protein n=1 Tax=Ascidiimonas aurantiaca TaxID=1685432 RepID=UPI0030EB62B6
MKKISKISGVKKLDRNELRQIRGGSCTQEGRICCQKFPPGIIICEAGVCRGNTCIFL